MLMIIPTVCHNCHKEVMELPFKVEWKYESNRCKHCADVRDLYYEYKFCSSRCLRLWSNKFDGHKHNWELSPYSGASIDKNGKVISVMTHCSICLEKNYHCKEKKVLKKREQMWGDVYPTVPNVVKKNDIARHNKKPIHKSKK